MAFGPDMDMQRPLPSLEAIPPVAPKIEEVIIFEATDPRLGEMTREERITQYYARELAADNLDALAQRFRTPEDGSEQEPWRDVMVADPWSDPRVSEIATLLKASGFKQDLGPEEDI